MLKRLVADLLMLVLSGAGALAQPISVAQTTAAGQTLSAHLDDAAHQCRHSRAVQRFEITVPPPPANMPCGSEHACCMRPGPANVAELPSAPGQERPEAQQRGVLLAHSEGAVNVPVGAALYRSSLPYGALNTVLRI